jgi:hypothetical protein
VFASDRTRRCGACLGHGRSRCYRILKPATPAVAALRGCQSALTPAISQVKGAFGAFYDGAVRLDSPAAFTKTSHLGWGWYAYYMGE